MQKVLLLVESVLILVLSGIMLWHHYQRPLQRWWKDQRARPKRPWTLRPRTPDDCQDCRLATAEAGPSCSQARRPWSEIPS